MPDDVGITDAGGIIKYQCTDRPELPGFEEAKALPVNPLVQMLEEND